MGGVTDYRAMFDAEVTFLNGGGLQTQGFRLDVPAADVTEDQLAELFIGHLGLLMVDRVLLRDVQVVAEPHRGSRGGPADGAMPASGQTRLVDLSHVITAGMTTYPGLPGPEIVPHMSREESRGRYAPGTEFTIDRISMVGNTGTYIDSPYHRYPYGTDLAGLPLTAVADLPVVVVRLAGSSARGIEPPALAAVDVAGAAVLLHTGWDRHWGTEEYGQNAPYLTEAGARLLVSGGAALVGIDGVNIDDNHGKERPAHSILLGAGIQVLEHLTGLSEVPVAGARLHAAPPRIRDFGTFPVRAYAIVPQ
jgi:kynurenine formamidase